MISRTTAVARLALTAAMTFAPLYAGNAMADTGWMAGGNLGHSKLKNFRLTTTSFNDTATPFEVFAGYKFPAPVAVTVGYLDLGSYHAEGPDFGGYVNDMKAEGIHVSGIGLVPLSPRFSGLVHAGVYFWSYKFHSVDDDDPDRRLSDSGKSLTYGSGFNVKMSESVSLHIIWQHFNKVGNRQTVEHENDYDLFVLGGTYLIGK